MLFPQKKKNVFFQITLYTVVGMTIWRMAYQIESGRYASALIFPFSFFAAYFLSFLLRTRTTGVICCFIGLSLLVSWTNKNYNINQISSNLKIIADLHDRANNKGKKYTLVTHADEGARIRRMDKDGNKIEIYDSKMTTNDVEAYINSYKHADRNMLFNFSLDVKKPDNINTKSNLSESRRVLSVFAQKNKKKREIIYDVKSKAIVRILAKDKTIPPESGILKNGDLELIDTPEDSHNKFRGHIGSYDLFFGYDASKRTPVNAYFHNPSAYSQDLPYYNCFNEYAISGKNSARFDIKRGSGFLLFYQRFLSGEYQYSFIFTGEKDTTICILYDLYQNNAWAVMPLATYTISNNNILQIKASFSVADLKDGEYFLVGAWVKGKAYLDNFCLIKTNNQN